MAVPEHSAGGAGLQYRHMYCIASKQHGRRWHLLRVAAVARQGVAARNGRRWRRVGQQQLLAAGCVQRVPKHKRQVQMFDKRAVGHAGVCAPQLQSSTQSIQVSPGNRDASPVPTMQLFPCKLLDSSHFAQRRQ